MAALDELIGLRVARVLTSGQTGSAPEGAHLIAKLVQLARGQVVVMAGAGVRAGNVAALVRITGVREVHLSASSPTPSRMQWHRPGVAMGAGGSREGELRVTDPAAVAAVVAALRPDHR